MTSVGAAELERRTIPDDRDIRRLALGTGVVGYAAVAFLVALFVVGQPFGTLNDILNGLLGILSAWLAWAMWRGGVSSGALTAVAGLGAAIAVVGSALVISGTTGFFLAGLVSSVGFALIGLWLVEANRILGRTGAVPRALSRLGLLAGAAMAFGFIDLPGIAMRLDDMAAVPPWIWVGSLWFVGAFALYPAWAIWLGLRRPDDR